MLNNIKRSISNKMSNIAYIILLIAPLFSSAYQENPGKVRTGPHAFTIQWITFEKDNKPGKVIIKSIGKNEYSIEGEQRDKTKNEYVTIKGTFMVVGRLLKFNGKIVSRIADINSGQPCESNGLAVFKASGKRKYWRLQQMLNCDGITTDYIDIFF